MKNSIFFRLLCAAAVALTITACKEGGGNENENEEKGPFVYVLTTSGVLVNGTLKYNLPAYQTSENGVTFVSPNAMYVSGRDVYVAGYMDGHYTVWKNGESQYYFEPAADESYSHLGNLQIFVYEKDVYITAGGSYNYLWKNGELQMKVKTSVASGKTISGVQANDIRTSFGSLFVSGGLVYIAGNQGWGITNSSKTGKDNYDLVVLWTNGVPKILETYQSYSAVYGDGSYRYGATIKKVFVEDGNVCVAAQEVYDSLGSYWLGVVYWLNSAKHTCSTGRSFPNDMCMKDGNVYIIGQNTDYYTFACLWTNGALQLYPTGSASEICFHNDDLYILGVKTDSSGSTSTYVLWKNDAEEQIGLPPYGEGIHEMFVGD